MKNVLFFTPSPILPLSRSFFFELPKTSLILRMSWNGAADLYQLIYVLLTDVRVLQCIGSELIYP